MANTSLAMADRLKALGLKEAGKKLSTEVHRTEKMKVAYRDYRFLSNEKYVDFNKRLRASTEKKGQSNMWGIGAIYDQAVLVKLDKYDRVPPLEVLDLLEQARDKGCFDTFEIMKIQSVEEVPDPILFGRIDGVTDLFYIAQWDDDIKIEDILQGDEGYVKEGIEG